MTKADEKKRLIEIAARINTIINNLPSDNSFKSKLYSHSIEEYRNTLRICYISYQSTTKITLPEAELWLIEFEKSPCRHNTISSEYQKIQKELKSKKLESESTCIYKVEKGNVQKLILVSKTTKQLEVRLKPQSDSEYVSVALVDNMYFDSELDATEKALSNTIGTKEYLVSELLKTELLIEDLIKKKASL